MANEKRLIYADALAEEIYQIHYYVHGIRSGKTLLIEYAEKFREDVLRAICKAPTVDAKEVVHGRWIQHHEHDPDWWGYTDVHIYCSNCMGESDSRAYNYCPNCGAEMRERSEGE